MTNEITNEELARLKEYAKVLSKDGGNWTMSIGSKDLLALIAKVESLSRANLELTRRYEEQKLQEQRIEVALVREKAKVESLAADAERLDWLETLPKQSAFGKAPSGTWQVFNGEGNIAQPHPTLREVIDAVMAKEKA